MSRVFRSGIYEYDKRKPDYSHPCATCPATVLNSGKKYCLDCEAANTLRQQRKAGRAYRARQKAKSA